MEIRFKLQAIIGVGREELLIMNEKEYSEFEDFKYNVNTYFYKYDIYQCITCYELKNVENFNGSKHLKTLILKPVNPPEMLWEYNFFQINGCHLWIEYTTECFKNEIADKTVKIVERD